MRSHQGGFTLIELIMVIVILGALAVVALPQYGDLQDEARDASADGVYGAAQSAAINLAANVSGSADAAVASGILYGNDLLAAMDGRPSGWTTIDDDGDGTADLCRATQSNVICDDADGDGASDYLITFDAAETATSRAQLSRGW